MLNLILLGGSLLISIPQGLSWYFRLWGLIFGTFFSFSNLWMGMSSMSSVSKWVITDGLSSSLIILTWWISALMIIASHNSVKTANNKSMSFSFYICLLNIILIMTFLSSSTVWFYIFFEMSLIPTLLLILGWGYQPERLQAGMYMMLYTVTASLPLLVLIVFTLNYTDSPTFSLSSVMPSYMICLMTKNNGISSAFFLIGLAAFLVKLPMYSVHLWLPKAHVEAPVAGSMVLAAILLKLGGYGILRMYKYLYLTASMASMKAVFLCFALWGGVITSMICFRQVDLKALIAYSSIGHMSLMLAGALSSSSWGWQAALGMMLAHGFCSSALFALANYNYEKTGTRSLMMNKGMLLVCPVISMWWFLFCVVNMAAPPSINLLSEILVFPSVMKTSLIILFPVGMMSFLAAVYSLFLYTCTQHGGFCKFVFPFFELKSPALLLLFLHYVPVNFMILKSDIICNWL